MNFNKTMIIVAHCDDEVLGAGGLIHNLSSRGSEISIVIVSPRSILSRPDVKEDYAELLMDQAEEVSKILGSCKPIFGPFDREITDVRETEVNRWIKDQIESFGPTVIVTHQGKELHNDHNMVSSAVSVAARPKGGRRNIDIVHFEPISVYPSSDFWPNLYLSMSKLDIDSKIKAMEIYDGELQTHQTDWRTVYGIMSRATIRGLESSSELAEAFSIWRSYI